LISRQSFGLVWLNPPYGDLVRDQAASYQGHGRARLEKLFYQRSLPLLQYGGVLVFIIPLYTLDQELVGWLTRHFTDLRIYRAVETQFKQVVIFGRRTRQRDQISDEAHRARALLLQVGQGETQAEELPGDWPFLPYTVPAMQTEPSISTASRSSPSSSPRKFIACKGCGPRSTRTSGPRSNSLRPPARALSHWHLALALAAGAISGVVTSKTGKVLVVKAIPTRRNP